MIPVMLLHEAHQEWWTPRFMPPRGVCSTQRVQRDIPCASMDITCWPASLLHQCGLRVLLSTNPTNSREKQQLPKGAACAGWSLPTAPLWIRADRLAMSRAHASGRTWGPTSDAISMQWYFWYSSKSFSLHKFSTELILGISPSFVVKREKKTFLLRHIENQNFPHSLNVLSIALTEAWSTGFPNLQLCHSVIYVHIYSEGLNIPCILQIKETVFKKIKL